MICAACEKRRHFECIDCLSNHSTYKCKCECHDENTPPHSIQAHDEDAPLHSIRGHHDVDGDGA